MVEVFTDVADTPMFRQKVSDLEAGAKRLRDRCSGFVMGTKKYRDGVAAMHDAEISFASALHEFCGGSDEDSLLIGGAVMSKYVNTFRELASFHDVLRAQVDVCLVEILQQTWVDGILTKVREDQKKFDKKMQEHEQARIKYLALKKVTKKEVLEKAHAELVATREAAEDLRFEIARKLSEVECRKRYMFLEAVTSSMHFHLKFFEHAHTVLQTLEPLINQTWEIVDHLKEEEEVRTRQMEIMVHHHKQLTADRERLLEQFSTVDEVGPLQMSASKQLLMQEIEALIRQTHLSGGTQVTIIKQAYLHKKSNQLRPDWKRRFFVLDSQGMLYYYSHKDAGMMGSLRRHKPKNTVNLLTSTVKLDDEDRSMRFCFRVVSPEGTYTLQAENELERHEWVDSLQAVINCLLNGDAPGRQMPRVPTKPTHSRSNSAASDYDPFINSSFSTTGPSQSGHQLMGPYIGAGETSAPLEQLRCVPGNRFCVDCGAPDPDWASLNLGVLLCIECSGLHRQLGVHVSKVRSCTLDVKVWEPCIIRIFEALGNQYATQVWEANLQRSIRKADSWVWCDESDDEESSVSQPLTRRSGTNSEPVTREMMLDNGVPFIKPTTTTPLSEKQKYVIEKYVNRTFVVPLPAEALQMLLWDAVERGDVRGAYQALASGVDINAPHNTPRALALAQDTQGLTGKSGTSSPAEPSASTSECADVTALHLAGAVGNVIMLEFLLQNNASFEVLDSFHRTPLHYCILHERADCAKVLLRRGAPTATRDLIGRTPFDLVMLRGRVSDEELFVLLSSTK